MHHSVAALTTLLHTCTLGGTATKQSVPCTTGLITHSGPERAPEMSSKGLMEARLQITKAKMEIPN